MNVARRSDGLLPAPGLVELWLLLKEGARPADTLAQILSIQGVGSPTRTLNSLALLDEMGLVTTNDWKIGLTQDKWAVEAVKNGLREEILTHYCRLLPEKKLGPVFQHDPATGELKVDRVLLPYKELGLPYLLVEFELVLRSSSRALPVASDAVGAFLEVLASLNARALRAHPMTPEKLDAWLAARRAVGEVAEAFAMEFERRRLHGHRLLDQVRWVSTEDIGAGFDILSFDDERRLLLDRSIEVKGYTGKREFYWSKEEIEAARLKREKYWLYLIDRNRISEQGYEPEMLNDPYTYLIEENPAGWLREATSYKFTAPRDRLADDPDVSPS